MDRESTAHRTGRRALDAELMLLPMAGVLVWLILFLMATARTSYTGRLNLDAQVSLTPDCGCTQPAPALHVHVMPRSFLLSWRTRGHEEEASRERGRTPDDQVAEVVWVPRREPAPGPLRYPELAAQVREQWQKHGQHRDSTERSVDQAVLHCDPGMPHREIVAIVDAIHQTQREFPYSGGKTHPAINVALVVDEPGQERP